MPTVLSVNVGQPREVEWNGGTVTTSIFKAPVTGSVAVRRHQVEGDRQADLVVHGGPTKAAYVYPAHHYDFWRHELQGAELGWGSFGENLTIEGVEEATIHIGDEFQLGGARVIVTEPRMPCFKLGIRFGRPAIIKQFLQSGRTGFYLGVVEEGEVEAGDTFERLTEHPDGLLVSEVTQLYSTEKKNAVLLEKALGVSLLPDWWREHFQKQLASLTS